MATAQVHCDTCDVDSSFSYPDDTPAYSGTDPDFVDTNDPGCIKWEHGCPAYQENPDGSLILQGGGQPVLDANGDPVLDGNGDPVLTEGTPIPQVPFVGYFLVPSA